MALSFGFSFLRTRFLLNSHLVGIGKEFYQFYFSRSNSVDILFSVFATSLFWGLSPDFRSVSTVRYSVSWSIAISDLESSFRGKFGR